MSLRLNRRRLLGAALAALPLAFPGRPAAAQVQKSRPGSKQEAQQQTRQIPVTVAERGLKLGADVAETLVPQADPAFAGRFRLGDVLQFQVKNALNVPQFSHFRGVAGEPATPPAQGSVVLAGREASYTVRVARPGTMVAEFSRTRVPFVVEEPAPPRVDRDEIMLIEEWRLTDEGKLATLNTSAAGTTSVFTLNRSLVPEIAVRRNERLRLRFINGAQRSVIALRIENANAARPQDLRVIAVDSRPAEPFPARNGQIALAPGARLDALVDASGDTSSSATLLLHDGTAARPLAKLVYGAEPLRPAPLAESPPLAEITTPRPDLRNAQRFEIAFDGTGDGTPRNAFLARRNRTVSLALTNKSSKPAIFQLGGHFARLLDRLDDGWKPYWVDIVPVDAGQTQRIAFVPENGGNFQIHAFAPEWGSTPSIWTFAVVA